MALRTAKITGVAPQITGDLQRIIITENGVETLWVVTKPDGQKETRRVETTGPLWNLLKARNTFQTMIDNVSDDTSPRAVQ